MTSGDLLGYLLFPAIVAATLLFLRLGPYGDVGRVNQPFEAWRRPRYLPFTIKGLVIVLSVVFVGIQSLRIPFYLSVFRALVGVGSSGNEWGFILQTLLSVMIVAAEFFVMTHLLLYLAFTWIGATRFRNPEPGPLPANPPAVALLIPACDEDPESLERSLSSVSRIRYPNLRVLLVENSRKGEFKQLAHVLAARYGVEVLDLPNRGHKAGALNDAEALLGDEVKYSAVFDADQRILRDIVTDAVALLEADDSLGLIQTPQLHDNCEDSVLACAIAQQQMLLYDCILEGKAALRRAPCYGTNFVIRRQALKDAGGWGEDNLTEDLTTSYYIHARGWSSLYLRRSYAIGLAPATLHSYWEQQGRWAEGNTSLFFSLLWRLVRGKLRGKSLAVVADYLWASSFYLDTFAISIVAICPTAMLIYSLLIRDQSLVDLVPVNAIGISNLEWVILSVYPLYLAVVFFPYLNMCLRGYPFRNMVMVQGLISITGPVFLSGVKRALFARSSSPFVISTRIIRPDAAARKEPILFTPQCLAFGAFVLGGSYVLHWGLSGPATILPWILVFWLFVHSVSLGHFFIFSLESRRLVKAAQRQWLSDSRAEVELRRLSG